MRIVIHIGFHKCGSTALQYGMAQSRSLLAAQNICYPAAHALMDGHHALPWLLKGQKRPGVPDLAPENIVQDWIAEADAANCNTLLLSSEEFEFLPVPEIEKLRSLLQGHATEIYAYVRPQDEYLIAEYKQHVRMAETAFSGSIENFYFKYLHHLNAQLQYHGIMQRWANAFGAAQIHVGVYDRSSLVGGDMLEDFVAAAGLLPFPWPERRDHNVSWSNLSTHIMAALNKIGISSSKRAQLADHLDRIVRDFGLEIELMDHQSRNALLDSYRFNNQKMLKDFHPRGNAEYLLNRKLPSSQPRDTEAAALATMIQLVAEIVGK